jgi:hypothetical protein
MSLTLRKFLAWCLLAALPWQGVAAAAMVLCQSAPQTGAVSAPVADHAVVHAHHPGHDGGGALTASHAAQHGDPMVGGHGLQADADHHCSACSLCSHGLAMPAIPVTLQTPCAPQGPIAGVVLRADSHVAPVPDKPPRA